MLLISIVSGEVSRSEGEDWEVDEWGLIDFCLCSLVDRKRTEIAMMVFAGQLLSGVSGLSSEPRFSHGELTFSGRSTRPLAKSHRTGSSILATSGY